MIHTVMWNDTRTIVVSFFDESGVVRQNKFAFFQISRTGFMFMCLETNNRYDATVYAIGDKVNLSKMFENHYSDDETFTITLIEKE